MDLKTIMKTKAFKYFIAILIIAATLLLIFNGINNREERMQRERILELRQKSNFGTDMSFYFQMYIEGERQIPQGWPTPRDILNPMAYDISSIFYTDVVFVHNEEQAKGFPEDVIVAWPNMYAAQTAIHEFHRLINIPEAEIQGAIARNPYRPVLTLEEFGLSYPLTIIDLVDNYEKVMALWRSLTPNERQMLGRRAASAAHRNEVITEW